MRTFAFIFARGGSKGVPGKNIRKIHGIPLLAHAIRMAKSFSQIEYCFVSTDSLDISLVAKEYGAQVIERPDYLSQDDSPEWLAWKHAVEYAKNYAGDFDCFLSLPATAPLRSRSDIENCLDKFSCDVDIVVTMTKARRSPWFNMVKEKKGGGVELLIQDQYSVSRRQDSPLIYELTTVAYVSSPQYIASNNSLWEGVVEGVIIPEERAIDIDSALDFHIAEILMSEKTCQETTSG